MASIGGLDVPYGSQYQVCRTNVLAIAVEASNTGVSAATAKACHDIMSQRLPAAIAPDFTCFFETTDATLSGFSTAGYAALFENDPDNDGTAESVSVDAGGVLRTLQEVPVQPGSARPGATYASGSQSYGTLDTGVANGGSLTAMGADQLEGSMSIESVLNVGVTAITSTSAATQDDLFVDDASPADGVNARTELTLASDLQSQVMETIYEDFVGNYSGAAAAGHNTGGGNCFALDLSGLVADTDLAADTGVLTATATTEFNSLGASSTMDQWLAAAASNGIGGTASIISITTLCRKV
jgi:hypothetical protein